MRIGSSIALIAVGLILALAVHVDVEGLDVQQIGWILAIIGVIGLVISLVLMRRTPPVVTREAGVRAEPYDPLTADARYQNPNARY